MSLYEALKKVDEQIEEIETDGAPAAPAEEDNEPEAPEAEAAAGKKEKDPPPAKPAKEAKKEEPAPPAKTAATEEEKPDAAAFAKLRRDLADERRNREAAENRARDALKFPPAAAEQPAAPAKGTDPEPDKNTDPDAHVRWELRQAKAQLQDLGDWRAQREKKELYEENLKVARDEFSGFEQQFQTREDAKDYVDVANYAVAAIAQSIRIMNPGFTQQQVAQQAELQLLKRAGAYQKAGHANPIEALYHEVKNTWGYQPKAPAAADPPAGEGEDGQPRGDDGKFEKKPLKPSLKQIADNKKKSASSMTPGGKSGNTPLTRDGLLKGGLSEWARLTPEQLRQAEELEG